VLVWSDIKSTGLGSVTYFYENLMNFRIYSYYKATSITFAKRFCSVKSVRVYL